MGELIQHFSGFDIQEHERANGIDVETIKKSVERSRKATANIERHANAGWWESLKNRALNNDKRAFSEAIQALGELSEIQLVFTMLGTELSRKTQNLQEEINKNQSQVEYGITALLSELKEQDEFIDDVHKVLASLDDKNRTAINRIDSIESMLMDIISADATLRDYEAVNAVAELLKDAISTHNKIKSSNGDTLIELAKISEKLSDLDTKNASEIRDIKNRVDQTVSNANQEISNLWERIRGQAVEINKEISVLGARSFDRMDELNSFIKNTNDGLTRLVLLKKEESDLSMQKGLDQLDASRKHMGQVLLIKIRKHVKSLIESDKRLDDRITESALAQANEINTIKAELARVQIWAKLTTSFALISAGWIIYTSLIH